MVFFGVGSVVFGKMSDIYNLKTLITMGLLIYCGGSLLGFLGHTNYFLVIAARIIQGIGGSSISALMMTIIARYIPPEHRGKAFGLLGSTVAFSEGIGPAVGGYIAGNYHWAALFLIPFLTLLALPFLHQILPDERPRKSKVDFPGAILLVVGISSLILYLTEHQWPLIAGSFLFLALFAQHIRHTDQPFIEPELFTKRDYMLGITSGFILIGTGMGLLFMVPLMLNAIHQLPADLIGWTLFPGSMSVIVLGGVGGSLADKRGNSLVFHAGLLFFMISATSLSLFADKSPWLISVALLPAFAGISFIKTAVSNSVTQTLDKQDVGIGMGMFGLVSFFSEAVGTALVGKVLADRMFDFSLSPIVTDPSAFPYSNLLLFLIGPILLGGALYRTAFQRG